MIPNYFILRWVFLLIKRLLFESSLRSSWKFCSIDLFTLNVCFDRFDRRSISTSHLRHQICRESSLWKDWNLIQMILLFQLFPCGLTFVIKLLTLSQLVAPIYWENKIKWRLGTWYKWFCFLVVTKSFKWWVLFTTTAVHNISINIGYTIDSLDFLW